MKFKLIAIAISAVIAAGLTQCTRQYTDGRTTKNDGTLRPGEEPGAAEERIAPNNPPAGAANAAAGWRADPDAPKQSNGGSGGEVTPPFEKPERAR